jgi:hypothetical protein
MNIVYRDIHLNLITQEQSELECNYYKDYEIDNLLGIRKKYIYNRLEEITHYKLAGETNQQILEKYANFLHLERISIRERENDYGSYKIDCEIYFSKNKATNLFELQPYVHKILYSLNGISSIAHERIDTTLPENDLNYKRVSKIHFFGSLNEYEYPHNARPYFCPMYDESGNVEYIEYNPDPSLNDDQDIETFELEAAKNWMKALGLSEKMRNWYLNTEFLPPLER